MSRPPDINRLTTEELHTLLRKMYEVDATLPSALTPEQRRRFHNRLEELDPSLVAPAFRDTRSTVRVVVNSQVNA